MRRDSDSEISEIGSNFESGYREMVIEFLKSIVITLIASRGFSSRISDIHSIASWSAACETLELISHLDECEQNFGDDHQFRSNCPALASMKRLLWNTFENGTLIQ
jgi:hypothetical protein